MRKVFARAYSALDEGADWVRSGSSRLQLKALEEALAHFHRSVGFDRDMFGHAERIVGLDEVGRGPLAGPLVAACVAFPSSPPRLPFLRDSKKLSSPEREFLAPRITAAASHLGYGVVEPQEFGGAVNLHHLTFLAMSRAIEAAELGAGCALLVDGKFPLPSWTGPQTAVIKGDDTSFRIAAASVLAKVYRDRLMRQACAEFPMYGFSRNVGYGTAEHRRALRVHGPCRLHRTNFVEKVLSEETATQGVCDERHSLQKDETAAHDSPMPAL